VIDPNLMPLSAFETYQLIRSMGTEQQEVIESYRTKQNGKSGPNDRASTVSSTDLEHLNPRNVQELIKNLTTHFQNLPQSKQDLGSVQRLLHFLRTSYGVFRPTNGPNRPITAQKCLTKAERLQICDLVPTEAVEIYLIVEECDSRFTEEEIEEILSEVRKSLYSTSPTDMADKASADRKVGSRRVKENGVDESLDDFDAVDYDEFGLKGYEDENEDGMLVDENGGGNDGFAQMGVEIDEVPD
ncbi:RNA polymerase Rpb4-domain-containing protein, partial [Phakopsora pachyrhizi]